MDYFFRHLHSFYSYFPTFLFFLYFFSLFLDLSFSFSICLSVNLSLAPNHSFTLFFSDSLSFSVTSVSLLSSLEFTFFLLFYFTHSHLHFALSMFLLIFYFFLSESASSISINMNCCYSSSKLVFLLICVWSASRCIKFTFLARVDWQTDVCHICYEKVGAVPSLESTCAVLVQRDWLMWEVTWQISANEIVRFNEPLKFEWNFYFAN